MGHFEEFGSVSSLEELSRKLLSISEDRLYNIAKVCFDSVIAANFAGVPECRTGPTVFHYTCISQGTPLLCTKFSVFKSKVPTSSLSTYKHCQRSFRSSAKKQSRTNGIQNFCDLAEVNGWSPALILSRRLTMRLRP